MDKEKIIANTIAFVKEKLKDAEAGHDWFHIKRVLQNAEQISATENVDLLVVKLAALLHDIADYKFHDGDESLGPEIAQEFLQEQNVPPAIIAHVISIIENISFKGGSEERKFSSPELDVVQDADRLDALGAIGIARTFNYGGFKNRPLFDPSVPPKLNMSKEEYKASTAPTVNHFYEKLFLLKDRMNTQTGRKMAEERHDFMLNFLTQFYKEWGVTSEKWPF